MLLRVELEGERPRGEGVVRNVLRQFYFWRYLMTFAGAVVVACLYSAGILWVALSEHAVFALLELVPLLTVAIFYVVMRRRRGEIERVARDGELVDGVLAATLTGYEVQTELGGEPRLFTIAKNAFSWGLKPGRAKVLASPYERFAIVLTSDGGEYAARASWFADVPRDPVDRQYPALAEARVITRR